METPAFEEALTNLYHLALDLLSRMLVVYPKNRISAKEAYFKGFDPKRPLAVSVYNSEEDN